MTKVNGNGGDKTNLEALKAYYEALNTKKAGKEEKAQEAKPVVSFKISKVDKSEAATTKRIEQYFNTPFMASLDELQGIEAEDNFAAYAMANVKGVDPDKFAKYMNKPLGQETAAGVTEFLDALV